MMVYFPFAYFRHQNLGRAGFQARLYSLSELTESQSFRDFLGDTDMDSVGLAPPPETPSAHKTAEGFAMGKRGS